MKLTQRVFSVPTVIVVSAVLFFPAIAGAAGFATPGVGIKARSMGGAFRGLADDWSAMRYNPAGLTRLKSSELNFTLGTYSPRQEYIPDVTGNGLDIGFDVANGEKRYPINDLWPIPSFAGVIVPPGAGGFVFGGAIYWPQDVNYSWDLFRSPQGYNTDYTFAKKNYRTDLDVLDIHPTVARKFGDKLSIGAGLSLTNADVVFRRVLFLDNGLGSPFNVYPFNKFLGDFRFEGNGFAVGGNIGLMWDVSDKLSIGISAQSPITVTVSGGAELDMAWPRNPGLKNEDPPVLPNGDTLNPAVYFSGINDPLTRRENPPHSSSDYSFDLDLPAEVGIGIGWTPSERWTIDFDAAVTFWSAVDSWNIALEGDGLNAGTSRLKNITIPFGWDDQIRVSGGFEYVANDKLKLRGGAYYDGSAAPDSTFSPNFPNDGNVVGLTGGLAYDLGAHVEFAAAQELAFYSQRTVGSIPGENGITVFPGDYSLNRFETIFSLTYRF